MEPLLPFSIDIPPAGSRRRLEFLHQQLRAAILDGRLKTGLRLPSTRALAAACSLSRNTVLAAYDRLLGEGYLGARRGSGTVVLGQLPRPLPRISPSARSALEHRVSPLWRRAAASRRSSAMPAKFTFQLGTPDFARFPVATWRRLAGRVSRRQPHARDFDPQGLIGLREAIAQHVSFARAVSCGPDDIVVTSGAQQAFDLLAKVLLSGTRATVALENPGYPPLREAFRANGARIATVPVDEEGLIVERLPTRTRVVCVTPSHQFPLGAVLSARRRIELLDFCRRRHCVAIEDDYDGEFRFVQRPLDALQTLDRTQSVFYVGTFSKCLSPALRLGYIAAPAWAREALVAAKHCADGCCGTAAQATLALFIKEGHLRRHVRKMQHLYGTRRALLLQILSDEFAGWLAPQPSMAGLHVTAKLQRPGSESLLLARALRAGVSLTGLRRFYAGPAAARGIVFGYGNTDEHAIRGGLSLLYGSLRP